MSTAAMEPGTDAFERSLRRSRLYATLAMVSLGLYVVLSVVGFLSDRSYHQLIQRALSGVGVSQTDANAADHRVHVLGLVDLGLYVVTAFVFIVWFRNAYRNVGRLGVNGIRWSPGWAVGAWFVPFLNFVRPKAIMNDIWRGSDPGLRRGTTLGARVNRLPLVFQLWWGLWIVGAVLDRIAFQKFSGASTLEGLSSATQWVMVSDVVSLVAAVLAICVVYLVYSRQRARARVLADSPVAPGY